MEISRRGLLVGAVGLTGSQALSPSWAQVVRRVRCPESPPIDGVSRLRQPALPQTVDLGKRLVGERPHRCGGIRLERDLSVTNKALIHNYGHSAAGITLSWGCADRVQELVVDAMRRFPRGTSHSIAVIGTGAIGLTSAHKLKDRYPNVPMTIYTKDFKDGDVDLEKCCSWAAGGQIEPSHIFNEYDGKEGRPSIDVLLSFMKNSMTRIARLASSPEGIAMGIAPRYNYTASAANTGFEHVVPECSFWTRRRVKFRFREPASPLEGPFVGLRYKTYLMNPQIMLRHLLSVLKQKPKTKFEHRNFASKADVLSLPHTVIINCTGLGSKTIFDDRKLRAIRGQILVLDNPDKIDYFYSGGCLGTAYMFGRQTDLVLGGTFEHDCAERNCDGTAMTCQPPATDQERCQAFVERLRKVFYGDPVGCGIPVESMMM